MTIASLREIRLESFVCGSRFWSGKSRTDGWEGKLKRDCGGRCLGPRGVWDFGAMGSH